MGDYEILEHTADVGLRARAGDLEDLFETATEGMATIAGVFRPGPGEEVRLRLEGADVEGLLVDWLNEVLYEHDARAAVLRGVAVAKVSDSVVEGAIRLASLEDRDDEGVQIKAVTYHQLMVRRGPGEWEATVFFDV